MVCILLFMKFKQVEKVFGASHPDPAEIEKAKRVLKVRTKHLLHFALPYIFSFIAMIVMGILNCRSMNKHWLMQLQSLKMHLMVKVVITNYV